MNLSNIVWTSDIVEEWLQNAARVERVLPPVGPRMATPKLTYIRNWIEMLWDEMRANEDKPAPRFQPTNEQVSMWEEVVLRWFALIDSEKDKKILWWHACGMGYVRISKRLGISRQTATNRYKRALEDLARALNRRNG